MFRREFKFRFRIFGFIKGIRVVGSGFWVG